MDTNDVVPRSAARTCISADAVYIASFTVFLVLMLFSGCGTGSWALFFIGLLCLVTSIMLMRKKTGSIVEIRSV